MSRKDELATAPERLRDSLGFLINGLARLMRNALEEKLAPTGLTATTWTALMALGEEDGQSQTDLSKRTFLDNATITRALDLLEAKGMIERNRDDTDRRVQNVTLTREGKSALEEAADYGTEVNQEATSVLSAEERRRFEGSLGRILANLQVHQMGEADNGR